MTTAAMTFTPDITLTQAMNDPALFGNTFSSPSFWTWKVISKLIDGLPLVEQREIELFEKCTGIKYNGNRHARRALRRLIILVGRRGGKDRFFSAAAVWRCICTDWSKYSSAGEGAVCILLGKDKKHAAILRKYCHGLLQAPLLAEQVARMTNEVIEFKNGSSLEIVTNDAGAIRGRSAIGVFGSETCFWKVDEFSSSSDEEVVSAALPSMAMSPDGGFLVLWSSVHKRKGFMYRKFRQLHGNDDEASDEICWYAPSSVMNPKLPARVVEQAMSEDPYRAGAEYKSRWREDLSDFIPSDVIERCTAFGIYERAPKPDRSYVAVCDPAGGTGADSFALAIAHCEPDGAVMLDVVRERKPRFVPAEVVKEYAALLKQYRISEIRADNFGGGFHSDEWLQNNIRFKPLDNDTSENYLHALPMLLSGRAHLIDSMVLRNQLSNLERTLSPSGHEKVSHPKVASAHDDVATAACGALVVAGNRMNFSQDYARWVDPALGNLKGEGANRAWQAMRYLGYINSFNPYLAGSNKWGAGNRSGLFGI